MSIDGWKIHLSKLFKFFAKIWKYLQLAKHTNTDQSHYSNWIFIYSKFIKVESKTILKGLPDVIWNNLQCLCIILAVVEIIKYKSGPFEHTRSMLEQLTGFLYKGNNVDYLYAPSLRSLEVDLQESSAGVLQYLLSYSLSFWLFNLTCNASIRHLSIKLWTVEVWGFW